MIPVIIEITLFIVLLYAYYKVSVQDRVSTFYKWVILMSSIGVLAFADKIKLIVWGVIVFVVWIIKYLTEKQKINGRTT